MFSLNYCVVVTIQRILFLFTYAKIEYVSVLRTYPSKNRIRTLRILGRLRNDLQCVEWDVKPGFFKEMLELHKPLPFPFLPFLFPSPPLPVPSLPLPLEVGPRYCG